MYKINISYGLPGSGKTTFFQKLIKKDSEGFGQPRYHTIDCDDLLKKSMVGGKSFEQRLEEEIRCLGLKRSTMGSDVIIYIDGLLTTNEDLIKLIRLIDVNANKNFKITVYWWDEDREACIWNDEYRRDESAKAQIKSLPFEKVDADLIESETGVKIKTSRQTVVRKSVTMHYAQELFLCDASGKFYSDEWCLGGSYGDWMGNSHVMDAEDQPEFTKFDEVLEQIAPSITFLKYKKLYKECVTIERNEDPSYYGGSTTYAKYVCDVCKLLDMLEEMGEISYEK